MDAVCDRAPMHCLLGNTSFAALPVHLTYLAPYNGTVGQAVTGVRLRWQADTASNYDVLFGTPAPVLVQSTLASQTFDTGGLIAATTYQWQIVARNGSGTTTGPIWTITTVAAGDVTFTPSPQDAFVTDYYANVYAQGTLSPVLATQHFGNPPTVAGKKTVNMAATLNALPNGNYDITIVTVDSMGSSESAVSNAFTVPLVAR